MAKEFIKIGGAREHSLKNLTLSIPRDKFFPAEHKAEAFADRAAPIGFGQTISQPYMVARIAEELGLDGDEAVLDVGTGSGYQAAVLAELADHVDTIERIPELAEQARRNLEVAGYEQVDVHQGDGSRGYSPTSAALVSATSVGFPKTSRPPSTPPSKR